MTLSQARHLRSAFITTLTTLTIASLGLTACATGSKKDSAEGSVETTDTATGAKKPGAPRPGTLSRELAALRSKQIGNVSYNLWFGLDDSHDDYQGRVVINFDLREKHKDLSGEVLLDFEGGSLRSLSINNAPVGLEQRHDGHRVHFKTSELKAGANRIEIAFAHAYSTTGAGLHRFKDPVDNAVYLYSDFEPYDAHKMFPCFDQPDLKASYELTVEAPEEWEVVSNTQERDTTTVDGRRSWAFPPSPVFSTYVFALHAGPFEVWKDDADGIPIRLFARQSLKQYVDHKEWFEVTKQGLEYFQVLFGYPYPYAKYDQLIVPDFNAGAMENVGAVTFTERYVFRSKVTEDRRRGRADTILHEMAHMWFGDLVTMRWWNGLWLNESFATLMATSAVADATKFKDSAWQAFFAGMKQWAYWEDQLVTTHPIETSVPDTDQAFSNFDGITYGKGAAVLKQLRFYLGQEDFTEGLQRYFMKFAQRNTTLADFMKMLSEASGENLAEWQRSWLQTTGLNTIQAQWACEKDEKGKSKISAFSLKQMPSEGNNLLRPHKTQIALYYTSKEGKTKLAADKETIELFYNTAETPVEAAIGKPCPEMVFPNHGDYDVVKVQLDPQTLQVARTRLAQIADPFARQMIWHTLWDMVVDGKLKAQDYADIVMSQIGSETDTQVLSKVLRTLTSQSGNYFSVVRVLDGGNRATFRLKIEEFSRKGLSNAPTGSDLQLVWLQAYREAAHSPFAIEHLQKILSGKTVLKGLKIDQERRWEIIQTLARNGASNARELIQAELTADPTDMGRKESIAAEVLIPDSAIKSQWLERINRTVPTNTEAPYKLSELKQAMWRYHVLGQEDLSRAAADAYFKALPRLAKTEDEEFLETYAENMFPPLCEGAHIQRVTDFMKQNPLLPAAVIKNLKINRQEEERCVRARALSKTQ